MDEDPNACTDAVTEAVTLFFQKYNLEAQEAGA